MPLARPALNFDAQGEDGFHTAGERGLAQRESTE